MGLDVVDVERTVDAHDRAASALHVARRAGMSRRMPLSNADVVADGVARLRPRGEVLGQYTAIGSGEREASAGAVLQFVLCGEPRFDGQRRDTGQPVLVVRRRKVVLWRHALYRVAEPSAGTAHPADPAERHPKHPPLPRFVKERLGVLVLDRAEPVEAAEVVHAVHAENPTVIVLCRCELVGRTVRDYS